MSVYILARFGSLVMTSVEGQGVCPICLEALVDQPTWQWCCGHTCHVGCVRRIACPVCRAPWCWEDETRFMRMHPSMAVRDQDPAGSSGDQPMVEMLPPQHLIPLCCPRVLAIDGEYVEAAADNRMRWFPTWSGNGTWEARWRCFGCGTEVGLEQLRCPEPRDREVCLFDGTRSLSCNLRTGVRRWVCILGGSHDDVPIVDERCGHSPAPAAEAPSPQTINDSDSDVTQANVGDEMDILADIAMRADVEEELDTLADIAARALDE